MIHWGYERGGYVDLERKTTKEGINIPFPNEIVHELQHTLFHYKYGYSTTYELLMDLENKGKTARYEY